MISKHTDSVTDREIEIDNVTGSIIFRRPSDPDASSVTFTVKEFRQIINYYQSAVFVQTPPDITFVAQ